ncbi:MAG: bifunctional oligoribonuclease/PAP phosphatase NrnA [Lachnospiraceae bacterium]|nr:bifunctional oligoribonuclease/PAP phosphatase NrnA [Lachnospiraceae bacterium]
MDIYEEVKSYQRIGIGGHIRPDGDCIGASLGLYFYLKKRLSEADIFVFLERPGNSFRNIPGIECIYSEKDYREWEAVDVFIALDTVPERMGAALDLYKRADKTINIDHHISNQADAAMVNYVVPKASATSELIYDVIDPSYLDAEIAQLLYMGMAHDTGVFHYSNTSPKTLRVAADLLEYGFDFPKLIDETFYEKTYLQNQILGRIILDSRRYMDGRIIIGAADYNFIRTYDAKKEDFEGVVNQLRITEGVECAAFIYEKEKGCFKCSLRASSDLVDVAKIAVEFGGGGHVRASGFDARMELLALEDKLVEMISRQITA